MSRNTCWLCKIFRAEENGISSNNTEECLMTPETAIWVRLSSRNPDSISTSACWMRTSLPHSSGQRSPSHWKRVSLEEVLQWSQSFEKLVTSKYGPMIYKTYLKTEHSDENIEFWLACEAYKKITSQRKRISMARKLFTSYIQPQAPNEINIDSPARKAIIRNIQEPTQSCFDEAQRIIYMHMERDSYPRFLESKFYQKLKHSLQNNGDN
ncbi:regulator of G-protein signaling 13 isoform X1 [Falco biarmicus]|uniref:regulator of G-protein signaling 13 isoform X1 n=1 Tax=Falco peregrinus TaxID=8954 RepID=UPI000FFB56C7|nr:regulator of G-protein signaling 13 isoform X1 [Falco peregrinus]XP_027653997.1 regulator of G-protein signaling 13 isoform X1 [Falco cherrug]XP_037260000.1 regulator of G-protein signaling 13 isoform X1 [Falco rusticolus]XP_056212258.1 regulator of G-protein signaling 13 isoform X1 [Falco biarmicus]